MVELLSTTLPPMHDTEGDVNDSGKESVHNDLPGSSETPQIHIPGDPDGKMTKTRQPKENPPYFDRFLEMQEYLAETAPQDRPAHIMSFIRSCVKGRPVLSKPLQRLLAEAEERGLAGGIKDPGVQAWDILKAILNEKAKKFDWAKDMLAEMTASEDYDLKALADHCTGNPSSDVNEPDVSNRHVTSQKSAQKAAVSKEGEEAWKVRMKAFQKQLGALDKIEKGISRQPVKQQGKGEDIAPGSHQASEAVYLTVLPGDRLILPNMPPDSNAIQGVLTVVRSWTDQFIKLSSAEDKKNSSQERDERFQIFKKELVARGQVQPKSYLPILNEMIRRMEMAMKSGVSWGSLFSYDEALKVEVTNDHQIINVQLTKAPSDIEILVGTPSSLAEASLRKPEPPDLGYLLGGVKMAFETAFEAVSDDSKTPKLDAFLHFRKCIEKLSPDMPLPFTLLLKANFDKMEAAARQALPNPTDLKWGDGPYALLFGGLEYEFDATQPDVPPPRSNDQDNRQPESSKSKKKRRGKKKKRQQEPALESQGDESATKSIAREMVSGSSTMLTRLAKAYATFLETCKKNAEDHVEYGRYTPAFYYFLQFKKITLEEASNCTEAVRQTTLDNLEVLEDALRRNIPQPDLEWGPGMSNRAPTEFDDQPESEVAFPIVQAEGSKNKRRRPKKNKNKNKNQSTLLETDLPSTSGQVDPPSNPSFAGLSISKGPNIEGQVNRDPGDHHCRENWCNHSCSFQKALAETIAALSAESPLDLDIKNEIHLEMNEVKRRVDIVDSFASEVEEPKEVKSSSSNEISKKNKTARLKKGGVRKSSPSKTKPVVAAKPAPVPCDSTKIRTHLSTEEVAKLYPDVQELDRRIEEHPDGPFFAFGRLDTPQLKRAVAVQILSSPRNYTAFMDCREQLNYLVACGDTRAALHSIEIEEVAEVVGEVHQEMTVLAKAKMKANHTEQERKNAPLTEKDLHNQKLAESAKRMREMEEKEKALRAQRNAKGKGVETAAINLPSDTSLSLDMMKTALGVLANGGGDGKNLSYNTFGPENPPTPQERRIIVQGLLQRPEMMASFIKNMNGIKEIQDNGDPKIAFFRNEARLLFETMKEFQPAPKPVGTSDPISGAPPTAAQKARLTEVYDVLKEMDTKFLNSKAEGSEMSEELFLRLLSGLSTSSLEDPLWAKVAPLVQKYILTSNNRKHLARGYASDPSRLAGFMASKLQLEELAKNTQSEEIQGMADEAATLWRDVLDEQAKQLGKPPSTANQDKPVPSVVEADTVKNFAAIILQDLVAAYSKASSDVERHKLALKYIMAHPKLPNTQAEAAAFSSGAKTESLMRYLAFLELVGNIPRSNSSGESEGASMLQKFKKEVEFVQTAIHRLTAAEASQSKGTASPSKSIPATRPVSEVPETSQTITQYPFRAWECLHDKLSSTDEQRKEANRRHNVPQGYVPSEFRDAAAFLLEYPVILANFKTITSRAKAVPQSKGDNELRKLQTVVFNLVESAIEAERLSPRQHDHVGSKPTGATPAPLKTFTSETLATYEAEYAKASTEADREAVNAKFDLMLSCNPTSIRSTATKMLLNPSKVSGLAHLKQKLYDDIATGSNLERPEPILSRLLMVEVAFNELTALSIYHDGSSNKPPAATLKPVSSSPLSSLLAYEAAYNAASTDQEFEAINEKFNLPDDCSPEKVRDFLPKMLAQGILPIAFYSIKVETEAKLEAGERVDYNQKLLNRINMADAAYRGMVLADGEYMKKIAADTSTHRYLPIIPSIERYEAIFAADPHEKRAINAMFMVPKDFSPELARDIAATDLMNRDKLSTFFKSKSLIEHYLKGDPNDYENQLFLNRSLLIEEAWRELMAGAPQYPTFDDGKPWIADQVKSNIDKFLVEDSYTEQDLLAQAKATLGTDGDLLLFDDHKNYIAFCAPHYPPAKKMLDELNRLESVIQKLQAEEVANARFIAKPTRQTATPIYEYTPEELATRRKDLADGFRRTQKSSLQPYEVRDKVKYLLSRPSLMSIFMEQRDIMERGAHPNDSINEKFMLKEMRKVYAEIEKVQTARPEQAGSSRLALPPPAVMPETASSFIGLKATEFPMAIGRAHAKAVLAAVLKPTPSVVPKSLTRPRSNAISQAAVPEMPVLKPNPAITVTSAPGPSIPVNRLLAFSNPNLKISPDPSFQPQTPQLPQDIEDATKAVIDAPVMTQKQVLAGLYAKSPKDYSAFKIHKSKFEESIKERPEDWGIDDDVQASKELAMVKEVDSIVKELRMSAASDQREKEKEIIEAAATYVMAYCRQIERHKEQIERMQAKLDELMEVEIEEPCFVPSKVIDDEVLPGDDKKKQTASGTVDAKILKAFKAGQKIRKNQRKKNKSPSVAATTPAEREVSFCGDVFEKISQTQMPVFTDPLEVIRFAMGKDPFAPSSPNTAVVPQKEEFNGHDTSSDEKDGDLVVTSTGYPPAPSTKGQSAEDQIPRISTPSSIISHVNEAPDSGSIPGSSSSSAQGIPGLTLTAAESNPAISSSKVAPSSTETTTPQPVPSLSARVGDFLNGKYTFPEGTTPEARARGAAMNDIQRSILTGSALHTVPMKIVTKTHDIPASPKTLEYYSNIKLPPMTLVKNEETSPAAGLNHPAREASAAMDEVRSANNPDKVFVQANPHLYPAHFTRSEADYPAPEPRGLSTCPITGFPLPPPAPVEPVIAPAKAKVKEKEKKGKKEKKNALADAPPKAAEEQDALKESLRVPTTHAPRFCSVDLATQVRREVDDGADAAHGTREMVEAYRRALGLPGTTPGRMESAVVVKEAEIFDALERTGSVYAMVREREEERVEKMLRDARQLRGEVARAVDDVRVWGGEIEGRFERGEEGGLPRGLGAIKAVLDRGELGELDALLDDCGGMAGERKVMPLAVQRAARRMRGKAERKAEMRRVVAGKKGVCS